jgi:predicted nucleic acid-binding protein
MPTPDPASVVADADVLAADLLVGGQAREALDVVRGHSWIELVASDPLLDDAEAVIASLATADLAADWRDRVEDDRRSVAHPDGDHPGLASALHGDAAHLLSFDPDLTSAAAGVGLQGRVSVSVRTPEAFLAVFDAASLYESLDERSYPGPDRDPRA